MNRQASTSYNQSVQRRNANETAIRGAKALGWFSIGLGLTEVIAPDKLARFIGVRDGSRTRSFVRAYGVREIASGIGILSRRQPTGWLWSRVAGDVLDLAALGSALQYRRSTRPRVLAATAAVLGVTALDVYYSQQLSGNHQNGKRPTKVRQSIAIGRSPEEVYQFWHNFENLPSFMRYVESVRVKSDSRSHWVMRMSTGKTLEWDSEITEDQPNRLIRWRSLPGSDINHTGEVRFDRLPGNRGTLVKLEFDFTSSLVGMAAKVGEWIGADPVLQMEHDLRALKQVMETGEVVRSDASIFWEMHPAQPDARNTRELYAS